MLAFFGVGPLELVIVAGVLLLVFGNRLPGVMRSLGRGIVEFKHGLHGIDDEDRDNSTESSKPRKAEKIKSE
jgi:sec-independent protein translocase protein TatA